MRKEKKRKENSKKRKRFINISNLKNFQQNSCFDKILIENACTRGDLDGYFKNRRKWISSKMGR